MVIHPCIPRTWKTEAGGFPCVLEQPRLQSETLPPQKIFFNHYKINVWKICYHSLLEFFLSGLKMVWVCERSTQDAPLTDVMSLRLWTLVGVTAHPLKKMLPFLEMESPTTSLCCGTSVVAETMLILLTGITFPKSPSLVAKSIVCKTLLTLTASYQNLIRPVAVKQLFFSIFISTELSKG